MRWRTSELWPCSALGRQSEGTCRVKAWVLREHSERWGKIKHISDEGCVCVCVLCLCRLPLPVSQL
ncbi:rCG30194 [Rattus norvegicus]|uniref:RCG30194 n=1 Tax=Rattus norvegicus TaxID=10116 RepID=A6IMJ5_RAT|nr:rCG30194 [Rattus norvegicus]